MHLTYDEIPPKFKDIFPPAMWDPCPLLQMIRPRQPTSWVTVKYTTHPHTRTHKKSTAKISTRSDQLKLTTGAINKLSYSSDFLIAPARLWQKTADEILYI